MKFIVEVEQNGKLSFLDIEICRYGNKYKTSLYTTNLLLVVYTQYLFLMPMKD